MTIIKTDEQVDDLYTKNNALIQTVLSGVKTECKNYKDMDRYATGGVTAAQSSGCCDGICGWMGSMFTAYNALSGAYAAI